MPEFLSAGVQIQELKSGQQAVAGVSTSNFASVGWLKKGLVNKATYVGSQSEFESKFGGVWANSDLPLAMTAFFSNGGQRAYIVRVVPSDAVTASVTIPSGLWKIDCKYPGSSGNDIKVRLAGNSNYYNSATAEYSKFDVYVYEETDGDGAFEQKELFEAVDLVNASVADGILTVVNDENVGSGYVQFSEIAGGIPSVFAPTAVTGESFAVGAGGASQVVNHVVLNTPIAPFTVQIKVDNVLVATDDGKGKIKQVGTGYTSIVGTVNYSTGASQITFTPAPASALAITGDYIKAGVSYVDYDLVNGLDGTSVGRSEVSDPSLLSADKKGLYALDYIDQMMNIGLPDFPGKADVHGDLIAYCENRKDCFAILDCPFGSDSTDAYIYKRNTLASQSSYAALYWPAVKVADPLKGGRSRTMSPVGHLAGIYARTDTNRNVAKAPAGVVDGALQYVLDLERPVTKSDMDLIYPANVNPLKADPLTGRVVWGTRTLQVVGDFNMIPIRRLFMFLEKSYFNNSQDLVFEPITDALFATIKQRFDGFLNFLTGQDYFASKNPSEAFKVVCDRTNNTDATIAQRLVIVDTLIAAANPAEFILLRFKRSLSLIS